MENEIYILIYFFSFLCGINSEEKPISSEGKPISSEEIAITSEEMPFSSEEINRLFCAFFGQKHPFFTLFFRLFGIKSLFFGRNKDNFGRNALFLRRNSYKWVRNYGFCQLKRRCPECSGTAPDYEYKMKKKSVYATLQS
jgi:hypothetical protein